MKTVDTILQKWLKINGYDGLYCRALSFFDKCSCPIDDLMSCNKCSSACEPGYSHINCFGYPVICGKKKITKTKNGHCTGCLDKCPSLRTSSELPADEKVVGIIEDNV